MFNHSPQPLPKIFSIRIPTAMPLVRYLKLASVSAVFKVAKSAKLASMCTPTKYKKIPLWQESNLLLRQLGENSQWTIWSVPEMISKSESHNLPKFPTISTVSSKLPISPKPNWPQASRSSHTSQEWISTSSPMAPLLLTTTPTT